MGDVGNDIDNNGIDNQGDMRTPVAAADLSWLDAAKDTIGQWAYIMLRDEDGNDIDWDWVRSLDLRQGIGVATPSDLAANAPSDTHDLLKADLEIRDRLEAIIVKLSMTFMRDFDRRIKTYELPRALAYADRRLNDQIEALRIRGIAEGLWTVTQEDRGRMSVPVLHAVKDGVDVDDIQDHTAETMEARAEKRKADRLKREESHRRRTLARIEANEVRYGSVEAGPDESAPADSTSDGGDSGHRDEAPEVINDDNPSPTVTALPADEERPERPDGAMADADAAPRTASATAAPAASKTAGKGSYWREEFLPGRDVDKVMGIDLETDGTEPYRAYIVDVGLEYMNMRTPRPADEPTGYAYDKDYYEAGDAYGQFRASFGVTPEAARRGNPLLIDLDGIDVSVRVGPGWPLFDEDMDAQRDLLERLTAQPFVAHMATFEHSFFMLTVAGYAEAYRDGHVRIIDTLPMSRLWDEGSVPSPEHPDGDNTLDAYAKRQGALRQDDAERHLGLEDTHIMLVAMKHHLTQLRAEAKGPWGPGARRAWAASTSWPGDVTSGAEPSAVMPDATGPHKRHPALSGRCPGVVRHASIVGCWRWNPPETSLPAIDDPW